MLETVLETLQEKVEGVEAGLLVGMDGVVVTGRPSPVDGAWEWMAASYTEIVRKLVDAHREAGLDAPRELVVTGEKTALVLRQVNEDYALLLALRVSAGSLGRARFELHKAAASLAPELAA